MTKTIDAKISDKNVPNLDLPDRVEDFYSLSQNERERVVNLLCKGDWCEQTAEFAKAINSPGDEMVTNYHRAIVAYLDGGWYRKAMEVALKLESDSRIREIYKKYNVARGMTSV